METLLKKMAGVRIVVLGDAIAALASVGIRVLTCREERSEIESALRFLTDEGDA